MFGSQDTRAQARRMGASCHHVGHLCIGQAPLGTHDRGPDLVGRVLGLVVGQGAGRARGDDVERVRLGTGMGHQDPIQSAGQCLLFLLRMLAGIRFRLDLLQSTLQQTYLIGARSLVIIMICGFFVGMVLSLQAINALEQFGASDQVSLLVGKSLFRELGPVLTALLFAGRAGTSITAEIGLMRATSQIDAMELMAIDPVQRVALPRFLAGLISVPLLTAMFNALAILGSVVFAVGVMGLDGGIFWSKLQTGVYFGKDFIGGVWKSVVFGGIVSLVAVFYGYTAKPTGAGVGTATTNTVVLSSVLILIFDFIMTSFFV